MIDEGLFEDCSGATAGALYFLAGGAVAKLSNTVIRRCQIIITYRFINPFGVMSVGSGSQLTLHRVDFSDSSCVRSDAYDCDAHAIAVDPGGTATLDTATVAAATLAAATVVATTAFTTAIASALASTTVSTSTSSRQHLGDAHCFHGHIGRHD